jgi:two-component system chemotaxis response regulator CheB
MTTLQPLAASRPEPYRVLLVDDSAVIRGFMSRWLKGDPAIAVVGMAPNGAAALKALAHCDPEVIVLDIEMPEMDGLAALPLLLKAKPNAKIVMASTLTLRNAEISMRALALGATDYIPKPTAIGELSGGEVFRLGLLAKIKALGEASRRRRIGQQHTSASVQPLAPAARPLGALQTFNLRPFSAMPVRVLAIGSSTGGPQALFTLFSGLKTAIRVPILITQHMPPNFTTILADHLRRISGLPAHEAVQNEAVKPGRIYVAPGDWHMTVACDENGTRIVLNQDPPESFCRPAVDPMLRSLANVYGGGVLAVILTGMGQDGLRGSEALVGVGASVIAQDEASSVVWGMPAAVAMRGLCSAVVPIADMAAIIANQLARRRP